MKETEKPVRYPVAAYCDRDGVDVVVCTDGSAWYLRQGEWEMMPPIPGTPAAVALTKEEKEKADG